MKKNKPGAKQGSQKEKRKHPHAPHFLESDFNLPHLEEKVLSFWDEQDIFTKSLDRKTSKKFVFYEGPPSANGRPGVHHVLSRVVKDIILRYKTMRGYYVPRRAGWDTQGLPIEVATEKALGLKSKKDIETYGIAAFNQKAKEQVWTYKEEWERVTRRIGYWLDFKDAYVTYEPQYIESIWWTMAQIAKRKLLYKGYKVVPWCTRCGTALSSHELAQGYKEVTDNSVYVKFRLKPGQKFGPAASSAFSGSRGSASASAQKKYETKESAYILSWTTTPWTLPGNVALAVGQNISYAAIRVAGERGLFILARDLIKNVFENREVEMVHDDIQGKDLVGLEYEPLFDVSLLRSPASYKVYAADFVTTTDGTGVVHTAVMYGEDDYALGKKMNLPQHHTVDEEGKFKADVRGFAGDYVKSEETEKKIFEHLRGNENLLKIAPYKHEYPFCWRCGTPILYYAHTSWFISMAKLRKELLGRNERVHWVPEHIKKGRFGEWLREVKDWNLSRERYWGSPLPVWECRDCGHTEVVESFDALDKLSGGVRNQYWVMRHGEAESNIFHIVDDGAKKLHLTPRGRKEVESSIRAFSAWLKKHHKKIDFVIASDVTRTHETEKIDAGILQGEKVVIDTEIEEIHLGPELTGCHDMKYHAMYPNYEAKFERRPPGGESLRDLRTRMWRFLKKCEEQYEGKHILVVSHEYPIWMLTAAAEGWTEKMAIAEKYKQGKDFIRFAEIRKLNFKVVPRNESGEIDAHRPFVDEILLPCTKCGAKMKRVPEIADVWYDSGAMPYAQVHYPFGISGEGKITTAAAKKSSKTSPSIPLKLDFPADYIAEGMDQTRGWFYSLLAIATALGYKEPYKNVITLGLINDKFGQKMSKSKGNVVEPIPVIEKFGIDALRWYLYTVSPLGEPKNFDEQEVAKTFRRTHLIVYNSFLFWKTYAGGKGSSGTGSGKSGSDGKKSGVKNLLDAWILARLTETAALTTERLDAYEIREAALAIESLIDDLSRWYIRRSRRRLQKPKSAADYGAASATLRHVLLSLVKMMAPFIPFFSELFYGELGGDAGSVHLDEWPAMSGSKNSGSEKNLIRDMKLVRDLAALGLAKRAEAGIKVRQPLQKLIVKDVTLRKQSSLIEILKEEVNVKEIVFDAKLDADLMLDTAITPELRREGLFREVVRMIQELRQKANLSPKDMIVVFLALAEDTKNAVAANETLFKKEVGAKTIEYRKSDKFDAEEISKIEGQEAWIGVKKV